MQLQNNRTDAGSKFLDPHISVLDIRDLVRCLKYYVDEGTTL